MISLCRAGDAWLWLIAGLVALVFGGDAAHPALKSATVAVAIEICLFLAIKRALRRPRPGGCLWYRPGLLDGLYAFPSGHAMTGFAVAAALGVFFPSRIPSLFCAAGAVAGSRVVTGMHFLSDVVCGALLGGCIGVVVAVLIR